jgi:hypothetical protein
VRSRIQQRVEAGAAVVYRGSRETVALMWRREGAAGFYKGVAPYLLRVMPQSAVTLAVYEGLLAWLTDMQAKGRAGEGQGGGGGGGGGIVGGRAAPDGGDPSSRAKGRRRPALTDDMKPLVVAAADSQADQ